MMRFIQALRFVGGLAMLVGGVAVLAPLAGEIIGRARPVDAKGADAVVMEAPQGSHGHAIPDPWPSSTIESKVIDAPATTWQVPQAPAYRPPPPPQPMLAPAAAMTRPAPELDPTYRSALAIPPPPLLDAHGPPPLAPGWTSRSPQRPPSQPAQQQAPVPATYMVRDGDDLTSLAIRFYGQPAAAAAILAANRDRITNPEILASGATLRLPPPWTITAVRSSGESRTIEPGPGMERGPTSAPGGGQGTSGSASTPWLGFQTPTGRS